MIIRRWEPPAHPMDCESLSFQARGPRRATSRLQVTRRRARDGGPVIPSGAVLEVNCWCERAIVTVTREAVFNGETRTCRRSGCKKGCPPASPPSADGWMPRRYNERQPRPREISNRLRIQLARDRVLFLIKQ